ncbi:MAG TPA: hypothetical protein VFN48_10525 [Solirubrobacteraceae bacterium]|nr:hypothetical protein [Solirubrobacteraceae bacterium]
MASPPRPLQPRDLLLLEALSHQRVAVLAQAAHWLGVSEATAARRVRALARADLVETRRIFDRGSPMLRITGRGLAQIGSRLSRPGQKLDEYRHDVGVGWVWTAARDGAFGDLAAIHSERALRSADARRDRLTPGERQLAVEDGHDAPGGIGVGAFLADGRPQRHYPDLLLDTASGRRIGVELELTHKGARRLDRIMEAYASDLSVDAVLYLVADPRIGAQIHAAAERADMADRVHVRRVARAQIGGVPGPERGPISRGAVGRRQIGSGARSAGVGRDRDGPASPQDQREGMTR